tara:strand:+ start:1906 stop:4239 length:2334 start_codon:yes stop_codon:yes gene_type:complete
MAKKKNNYNMSVVDLSHYNIPHIIENDNKDWISFGVDNLYPQYLIELFTGSGINSAIIKGVSSMIAGDQQGTCQGLDVVDKDILEGEQKEQYLKFSKLLKKGDRNTIKNLAFDLKLFGTCYVNTIWNKTKTAIAEIKHIPAQYIRSGKADSFGKVNEYYYCYDWSNQRKYKPSIIKAFNTEDRTATSQLLQIKEYNPQSFYYGIPDYVGGTDYIRLDMSIAELHLANIDNNFMPSCMVNFSNGIPSDEQRMEVERKLNEKFSGSGNSGKLIITFNEGKDTAPEIVPLNTGDNDDKYQFLSTEVSRKILTAHRVTSPLLFGVKGDGSGFGNNADELRDSYSLFNSSVIKVFQSSILQGLDEIFRINGINSLDIYFKTLKPADFLDLDHVDAIDEQTEGIDIEEDIEVDMDKETIEKMEKIISNYRKKNFNSINFKSLEDIDTKPTKGMIEEAKKGLEWRKEYGRGGTEVGVARARDISNGKNLSIETIKRMNSFFARHEKSSKEGKGFEIGEEGFPSAGRIAWALWGGDAGQSWANKKTKEIEGVENMGLMVKDDKVCLDYFDDIGITLDNNEWFEAYVESVDDHKVDKRYHEFAYAPAGTPNVADSSSDIGMFRVLYRYSQNLSINKKTGQISSREFCQKMVAKSVAGTLYRIEDLEKASSRAVNKGFGAGGSNTYNIALYKGGANCKHKWERVFYFRRIVPQGMTFVDTDGKEYQAGEYLPNGTLNNFRLVSQQFANGKMPMPDDAEMRKTTWKMKNHGFLKPRKEKERSYSTKAN